jgi:hypothetical protein
MRVAWDRSARKFGFVARRAGAALQVDGAATTGHGLALYWQMCSSHLQSHATGQVSVIICMYMCVQLQMCGGAHDTYVCDTTFVYCELIPWQGTDRLL